MARAHRHAMAEQIADPPHDRKAEAKPQAAFARLIADLMVFLENRLDFGVGNADAGIPDLDAQHSVATPAAEQDLAALACISAHWPARLRIICSSRRGSLWIVRLQGTMRRTSFSPEPDRQTHRAISPAGR